MKDEALIKHPFFHEMKDEKESAVYIFRKKQNEAVIYHFCLYIPKQFDGKSHVELEEFLWNKDGQLSLYFGSRPSWADELVKTARSLYQQNNRLRALFVEKRKTPEELLDET